MSAPRRRSPSRHPPLPRSVTYLAVSKEPSAKGPKLTEFDVKKGHGIVDVDAGDNLLPAKAVQDSAATGGSTTSAALMPSAKGGFMTGSYAAPVTLTGSISHMAKAAMGSLKGMMDTVTGHTSSMAPSGGGGGMSGGGKTTTPVHAGAAGAGSPPSPRDAI